MSSLDSLVELNCILKRTPHGYAFDVEAFPRVLRQSSVVSIEFLLERCLEDHRDSHVQLEYLDDVGGTDRVKARITAAQGQLCKIEDMFEDGDLNKDEYLRLHRQARIEIEIQKAKLR